VPPLHSPPLTTIPLFMQALAGDSPINYSAEDFRKLNLTLWPTGGILGPSSFRVTQADTVGWSIKVSSGAAAVGGSSQERTYLVTSDTSITLNLASSIQTQVIAPQEHAVFLVVQDKGVYGNGYFAEIVVATDEGAGYSIPDGAATLPLAWINVAPGQTNIQNTHISARPQHGSPSYAYEKLAAGGFLNSGFVSAHTAGLPISEARIRYGNGRVWFSGGIQRSSGTFTGGAGSTEYTLGTLPARFCPHDKVWLHGAGGGDTAGVSYRLDIRDDGLMTATVPANRTFATLFLDGVSYEID
jgi:hypothetical protein